MTINPGYEVNPQHSSCWEGRIVGNWISRDPLHNAEIKQGPNLYEYCLNSPSNRVDPIGLAWSYGGEFHFFGGFGDTKVTCCDENNNKRIMTFVKVCIGGAVGGGGGGGKVFGMEGKKCRPNNYAGWFYEVGASYGVAAVGGATGIGGSGYSGVNEVDGGGGFGLKFKSTWCYYILVDEQVIKCGCKK